jgi:peptide-methionine (S)-S-oxide reductase
MVGSDRIGRGGFPRRPWPGNAGRERDGGERDSGSRPRRTGDGAPKGVQSAQSGYAGGDAATANYDAVTTETTGHAESVRITFDPTQVSYGKLLQVFFAVVQDPTELDRQGPDVGPSYRSVIFAQDDTQQKIANAYIAQLNASGSFPAPIVTAVAPQAPFFPAEAYHQNFFDLHPNNPYIVANDLPKLGELKSTFPDLYRD